MRIDSDAVDALNPNDCVVERFAHDKKIVRVIVAGGERIFEQYAIDHLKEARCCEKLGAEVPIGGHGPKGL